MANAQRNISRTATILAMVVAVVGCTVDQPETPKYDSTVVADVISVPDYPPGCPKLVNLMAPKLDQYPNPTAYAKQPFRGTCAGAATITATGGAGTSTANVDSKGKFCIEVTLILDAPNTVKFQCLDAQGCPAPTATTINITHKSSPKSDAGITVPINLARNQPITAQPAPKSGSTKSVVDGKSGSYAGFEFWDRDIIGPGTCDNCAWVKVDLGKTYTVSEFKVSWFAQKNYAKCYTILTSSSAAPLTPLCDKANVGWKVHKQETAGDYKPQSIKINPVAARWAALLMYENESSGMYENLDLDEFEVWGQDPDATPPTPPDKCK